MWTELTPNIFEYQGCKKCFIRKIVFAASLTFLTKAKKTVISINFDIHHVNICHLYHTSNIIHWSDGYRIFKSDSPITLQS